MALNGGIADLAVAAGVPTAKAMIPGAATATLGWVVSSQEIALIGLALTIAGFFINLFFQIRRDRREEAWHKAKLSRHPVVVETEQE